MRECAVVRELCGGRILCGNCAGAGSHGHQCKRALAGHYARLERLVAGLAVGRSCHGHDLVRMTRRAWRGLVLGAVRRPISCCGLAGRSGGALADLHIQVDQRLDRQVRGRGVRAARVF